MRLRIWIYLGTGRVNIGQQGGSVIYLPCTTSTCVVELWTRGCQERARGAAVAPTRPPTAMLGFLASAAGYSPIVRARPLMLPEAAAFYTSVVHGEQLTPAQRLLLERRSLNEMKERPP